MAYAIAVFLHKIPHFATAKNILKNIINYFQKPIDISIFFVYTNKAVAGVAELADAHV